MRPSTIAPLAALLALAASCNGPPPERPPGPVKTAAPPPTVSAATAACEEAGNLLAAAKAALDEGRLLRARRWATQAAARCPARAGEGLPIEWRAAVALNDAAALDRLKSAIAATPQTPAIKEATASQAPYGGDVPEGVTPSPNGQDYYRAARAFFEGKLDEAARGALSVALSGSGRLVPEAFVLAAKAAEAAGDAARANRMYARAFHAACGSGCDAPVHPPRPDLFLLAATYPGLRLAGGSCVQIAAEAPAELNPPFETLTPDGRFYVASAALGADIRAVPERILTGSVDVKSIGAPADACFSDRGFFYLAFRSDQRNEVFVGPVGGEPRAMTGVKPWIESRQQAPVLTALGGLYLPNNLDLEWQREWYRAAPGDSALKRLPLPAGWFEPALLPNGEIIGFEKQSGRAGAEATAVAAFDGTSGKRLRVLGAAPEGRRLVLTQDGQRLIYHQSGKLLGVFELSAGQGRIAPVNAMRSLQGVVDASRVLIQDEDGRYQVADWLKGESQPAALVARASPRSEVAGGRLLAEAENDIVAINLSDGRVTVNEGGVRFSAPKPPSGPNAARERPRPQCSEDAIGGESGAMLYRCGRALWRDHPQTQAPAELLGELPQGMENNIKLTRWDESSGLFFIIGWDGHYIGHAAEKRVEVLRLRFVRGGAGGMAVDNKGYFEFFGEVPGAFRKAAACRGGMPIEVCADVLETPGLVRRFVARDFLYRAP